MSNEQKEPRFFVDHLEIYDNDFTHDAKFTVTGDFKDANQKHFYLECICQKLNERTDTSQQQAERLKELERQLANAKADGVVAAVDYCLDYDDFFYFEEEMLDGLYRYANQLRNNSGE